MQYKQLSFSSQLGLGRIICESVIEAIPDAPECPRLSSPGAAVRTFQDTGMHLAEQEELWVIGLDNAKHVRYTEMVYRGTGDMMVSSPRDMFRAAVREGCMSIFVAHNHPSGYIMPSPEDKCQAGILQKAGWLLGIEVTDYFILSGQQWISFKEHGYLQPGDMDLI